jgi:hypothetical protein
MSTIPQEAAIDELAPYLPTLREALMGGWADYQADPVSSRVKHSTRTRASIVYDYVMDRLRSALDDHSDVKFLEVNRLVLLLFKTSIVVRIKKFDETLRSSGIRTKQRRRLLNQVGLPGIGALIHLEAGYQLNGLQTDIEGTYLVCPLGNDILWAHALGGGVAGAGTVIPLSLPTLGGPIVRLRHENDKEKKGDANEGGS